MRQSRPLYLILSAAVLVLMLVFMTLPEPVNVFAQGAPAADTPTEQPTEPPTDTPTTEPPTATATTDPGDPATPTPPAEAPTATPTTEPSETVTPPAPVTIPEPITVVLFGTGLAALSAAAASRRKNDGKGDD